MPDSSFTLTGGGAFCSGGAGLPIGLSGSQLGVTYQLYLNGSTPVGFQVLGTGSAISFGNQSLSGIYTVRAITSSSCTVNLLDSAFISVYPVPVANAGIDASVVACSSDSVQIGSSPTASGGTAPYTYLWTPSVGIRPSITASNPYVGNIGSGTTYTVIVTDANGCVDSDFVFVDVTPSTLGVSLSSSGVSDWCEGSGDTVEFTANITGGSAPFTYSWTGTSISPTNTQVVQAYPNNAGLYGYGLIVTDASGCQVSVSRAVTVHALPDTFSVLGGGTICLGISDQEQLILL